MSENMGQFVFAAAGGDTDAMAKLYSKTLKASYFLAEALSGDASQAAEITKKAYAKAFCTIGKLKKPEAFEIWMKQIVASVYKETQRFVFSDAEAGTSENATEFLPEEFYENPEKSEAVLKAVAALTPELRTALVLHYNNGMPVAVIAKFLGVSESTANALLVKARTLITASLGVEFSAAAAESLPVLSKIFRRAALEIKLDNGLVREVFLFAIDAYNAVTREALKNETPAETPKESTEEEAEASTESESSEETAEQAEIEESETVDAEEETEQVEETQASEEQPVPDVSEVPEAPEAPEAPAEENGNVISFKQKIDEILSSENIPSAHEKVTKTAELPHEADDEDDGLAVPEFSPNKSVTEPVTEDVLDAFEEEPSRPEAPKAVKKQSAKFDLSSFVKTLTPKKIAIGLAAVLVVILAIVGVAKLAGGSEDKDTQAAYTWIAGGFEECEEIRYLNEDCCVFKSKTTGKYGLLDYQGNVILQPNYDEFKTCGSGRDHSNRGSYHILVKVGNEYFEVTVTGTGVSVSSTSHASHSIVTDELPEKSAYDERDRYFEGYAAARKDGKWGYVSLEKDKKVIPYEYEAVNDFDDIAMLSCDYCRSVSGGLIPVKKDGKMGIINLDNDVVVPFEYTNILEGSNGIFIAQKDGVWGVILTGDAIGNFAGVNVTVEVTPPAPTTPSGDTADRYVVDAEDGANVRSDAGADYDKLGELDEGDEVLVITTKKADNGNKWACIEYDGGYGWVAMANLKKVAS